MKLVKLDRRYKGFGYWTHKAETGGLYSPEARRRAMLNFYDQRQYLTRTNGPGCFEMEAHVLHNSGQTVPEWGFNEMGDIFLADTALSNFILAMEKWK